MDKSIEYQLLITNAFKNKIPSNKPTVTFICGQTGAGKSSFISQNIKRDTVLIIPDEYLINISKEADKLRIVSTLSNEIETLAIKNKNSLLIETTAFHPNYYEKECNKFKNKGYQTEFIMVATNKELSSYRMLKRNEEFIAEGNKTKLEARIGTLEIHDQLLYLLKNTLREIDESKNFDAVKIVKNTGEELYNSNSTKGFSAEEIFEKETSRNLTRNEISELNQIRTEVLNSMKKRDDPKLKTIENFFEINEKNRITNPWLKNKSSLDFER